MAATFLSERKQWRCGVGVGACRAFRWVRWVVANTRVGIRPRLPDACRYVCLEMERNMSKCRDKVRANRDCKLLDTQS